MISNITRIEHILQDPDPGITLDQLKDELNELAKLRSDSRVAFCKRLAVAYMLLVGRPYSKREPNDGGSTKFFAWCHKNIRTANSKEYSSGTLGAYLRVGFSNDPAIALKTIRHNANRTSEVSRKLGVAVREAIVARSKKVVPIPKLQERLKVTHDVAREVNNLMRAWEEASSEARSQFIYLVTGRKINAA